MKQFLVFLSLAGAILHGQSLEELLSRDDGKDKFLSLARHFMQKKQYNRAISYYERYFTNGGTSSDLTTRTVQLEARYDKLGTITVPEHWIISEPKQDPTSERRYTWEAWSVFGLNIDVDHLRRSSASTWNMSVVQSSRESLFKNIYDDKYHTRAPFYGSMPRSSRDFSFASLMNGTVSKEVSLVGPLMWGTAQGKTELRESHVIVLTEGYALRFNLSVMNESTTLFIISYPYRDKAGREFTQGEVVAFLDSLIQ